MTDAGAVATEGLSIRGSGRRTPVVVERRERARRTPDVGFGGRADEDVGGLRRRPERPSFLQKEADEVKMQVEEGDVEIALADEMKGRYSKEVEDATQCSRSVQGTRCSFQANVIRRR